MSKLAVYFPGIGYHCDKPLLYFSRKLAMEAGYEEYLNVTYTFSGGKIRGDKQKMKETFDALYAQTLDFLKGVKWDEYDDIIFISKSIGTVIATSFAREKELKNVRQVLYTPLEYSFAGLDDDKEQNPKKVISFIGTADPWSEVPRVIQIAEGVNVPIHIYEDANHSLETPDTMRNISILEDVMEKTKEFLQRR